VEGAVAGERGNRRAVEYDRGLGELGGEVVDARCDEMAEEKFEGDKGDEREGQQATADERELFHG
jgi:hypothetical protein